MITYGVVTKIPDPLTDDGNLEPALDRVYTKAEEDVRTYRWGRQGRLPMRFIVASFVEVFRLGEVLILGDDGRELVGARRDPDRWRVKWEQFTDLDAAVKRAQQVLDQ
jgi:hypothetical protein